VSVVRKIERLEQLVLVVMVSFRERRNGKRKTKKRSERRAQ
jgi:hypothetical protein